MAENTIKARTAVRIAMDSYRNEMESFAIPHHRTNIPDVALDVLVVVEHRGFRNVLGQLQWAARMM